MMSKDIIKLEVFKIISKIVNNPDLQINDDMKLIGGESILDSMKLVELCLALEDKASDLGFEFDWTSDVAMSKSKSIFRNASALAIEFATQMEMQK